MLYAVHFRNPAVFSLDIQRRWNEICNFRFESRVIHIKYSVSFELDIHDCFERGSKVIRISYPTSFERNLQNCSNEVSNVVAPQGGPCSLAP